MLLEIVTEQAWDEGLGGGLTRCVSYKSTPPPTVLMLQSGDHSAESCLNSPWCPFKVPISVHQDLLNLSN